VNISTALSAGTGRLQEAGIADARREAASLLAFILKKDPSFLIAHPEYELDETETRSLDSALDRRAGHEPFQYVTGRQEFWRLDFEVTSDVLIPRPETEILVEAAIEFLSTVERPRFCEVGVGSGCIAVSILHSVESALAVATDVSRPALEVAARNARAHRVDPRIEFRLSDVFDGVEGSFDLIVSNPPYVSNAQLAALQTEVRDFEPSVALAGGPDGLTIVRKIIEAAPERLRPGGLLLIEIGFDQAERVEALIDADTWVKVAVLPDLQGIPRVLSAHFRSGR
jgi:release factor glutamine methyltransferase